MCTSYENILFLVFICCLMLIIRHLLTGSKKSFICALFLWLLWYLHVKAKCHKIFSNNLTTVHFNFNFWRHTQVCTCTICLAKMLQLNVAVIHHLMIKKTTDIETLLTWTIIKNAALINLRLKVYVYMGGAYSNSFYLKDVSYPPVSQPPKKKDIKKKNI